ncbi:unnamed protein product, partial [Amoebophrya sp. A120]
DRQSQCSFAGIFSKCSFISNERRRLAAYSAAVCKEVQELLLLVRTISSTTWRLCE